LAAKGNLATVLGLGSTMPTRRIEWWWTSWAKHEILIPIRTCAMVYVIIIPLDIIRPYYIPKYHLMICSGIPAKYGDVTNRWWVVDDEFGDDKHYIRDHHTPWTGQHRVSNKANLSH
jgi:hypothetical protein